MIQQIEFKLNPQSRSFHLINEEVIRYLPQLPKTGLINLFVKHTSCALTVDMIHQYTLIARLVKSKIHYFALIKTIEFVFFWYKISVFLCKFAEIKPKAIV